MIFVETAIKGVLIIDIEPAYDERGFFARTFCAQEFASRELCVSFAESSLSANRMKGTLRGLHFQASPYEEVKLVKCVRGAIFDVAVDLRRNSASYGQWVASELTAENHRAVYIPHGCAHGFLTLESETEVFYQISAPYRPEAFRGIRWNDPKIGIDWPSTPTIISSRDASLPTLSQWLETAPSGKAAESFFE